MEIIQTFKHGSTMRDFDVYQHPIENIFNICRLHNTEKYMHFTFWVAVSATLD